MNDNNQINKLFHFQEVNQMKKEQEYRGIKWSTNTELSKLLGKHPGYITQTLSYYSGDDKEKYIKYIIDQYLNVKFKGGFPENLFYELTGQTHYARTIFNDCNISERNRYTISKGCNLIALLKSLESVEYECILLYYKEHLSCPAIASILNISKEEVRKNINRVLYKLRCNRKLFTSEYSCLLVNNSRVSFRKSDMDDINEIYIDKEAIPHLKFYTKALIDALDK